jgi:predicted transcriptional regulator YheO
MDKNLLNHFERLVQMLRGQFGESCQVLLYKLGAPVKASSLLAASGALTPAGIGDPLPDFIIRHVKEKGSRDEFGFINKTFPGLVLRTSLLFVSNKAKKAIGCFCIHHNIVHIQMLMSFLEEFIRSSSLEDENEPAEVHHTNGKTYAATDIQGFMDTVVSEFAIERLGKNSFTALDKSDKVALIAELDSKGIFLVKGAVNLVAKRLNISKFSVYNYLDEIRLPEGG